MLNHKSQHQIVTKRLVKHTSKLLIAILILGLAGCSSFFHSSKSNSVKNSKGEKIDVNDKNIKTFVQEWSDAKPSIDRLAKMETDLSFLLGEVSKMSDLGQVPGLANNSGVKAYGTGTPMGLATTTNGANTNSSQPNTGGVNIAGNNLNAPNGPYLQTSGFVNPDNMMCTEPFSNSYKKSVAFFIFPRAKPESSKPGSLYNVEQHLPLLLGANLRNRYAMPTPAQLNQAYGINNNSLSSAQVQSYSRQKRVQFLVTGEVDDMTMIDADAYKNKSYYTRFVDGVQKFFHLGTPIDRDSRVFSFSLQVRDGITGQVIFTNQYQTFGKWNTPLKNLAGFASPQFWMTDYGQQIQSLVGKASDELATTLQCQPFLARVDARPGQQPIVIQSGTNSGLHSGDALELYQVVYEQVTGQYQEFQTRLVKRDSMVYLTETYQSHSVGQVVDNSYLNGQYVVKAM